MNYIKNQKYINYHIGFSLVEMMIAMAISLVISMTIIHMILSHQQLQRWQHALAEINETGQFILNFISHDLALTGYIDTELITTTLLPENGMNHTSDSITIFYAASGGEYRDCIGKKVIDMIENSYSLKKSNYDEAYALTCNGQALIANIENFQLLYGIDRNKDREIDQYVNASYLFDEDIILAIQLGFVVRSRNKIGADSPIDFLLDVSLDNLEYDGYLRKKFVKTVQLKNLYYDEEFL